MKRNNTILFIGFILLANAFCFSSCDENDNVLSEKESNIVDSLYRIKKKELKSKLDTICDSVYNAQFPIFVDSIKAVRKKEILDLMEK